MGFKKKVKGDIAAMSEQGKRGGGNYVKFKLNIPVKIRILQAMENEIYSAPVIKGHFIKDILEPRTQENKMFNVHCWNNEDDAKIEAEGKCPLCKLYKEIWNKGKDLNDESISKLGKDLFRPSSNRWARCIVRGTDESQVHFIKLPKPVWDKIDEMSTEKDAISHKAGYDITITQVLKNKNNKEHYTNITYTCKFDEVMTNLNREKTILKSDDENVENVERDTKDFKEFEARLFKNIKPYSELWKTSLYGAEQIKFIAKQLLPPVMQLIGAQ